MSSSPASSRTNEGSRRPARPATVRCSMALSRVGDLIDAKRPHARPPPRPSHPRHGQIGKPNVLYAVTLSACSRGAQLRLKPRGGGADSLATWMRDGERGQSVTAADGYDAARRLGSINQWGADPGRSVTGLAGRAWSGPDRGVRRLHRPKHRFACSGLDFAHGHRQAEAGP